MGFSKQKGRFKVFFNTPIANINANAKVNINANVHSMPKSRKPTSTNAHSKQKLTTQKRTESTAGRQSPVRSKKIEQKGRFKVIRNINSNNHDQLLTLICDLKKMLSKFSITNCK